MTEWFEVERIEPGLWVLTEPHADSVNSYVVTGSTAALLVDTGLGIGDVRAAVHELVDLPLQVINTHAHYDHMGGNALFDGVAAHGAEAEQIERGVPHDELGVVADPKSFLAPAPPGFNASDFSIAGVPVVRRLEEGDIVDLGDRRLIVLHTPGHSPGSISLLDQEHGLLFVGDVVYQGNIFACLPGSDFFAYRETARRLSGLAAEVRLVLPGHGPTPLSGKELMVAADFFEEVAAGAVPGRRDVSPWGPVVVYRGPGLNLLLCDG